MLQISLSCRASRHRGTLSDRLAFLLPPSYPRPPVAAAASPLCTSYPPSVRNLTPAFFHTTRPDFMPSYSSTRSQVHAVPQHQGRVPYTPNEAGQPCLPPIATLPASLHALHSALGQQSNMSSHVVWQVFLSLDEAAKSSLSSGSTDQVVLLFRCLWWSIASYEPSVPIQLPHLRRSDAQSEMRWVLRCSAGAVRSFRELRDRLDQLALRAPQGVMKDLERARYLYVHTAPYHLLRQMHLHMPNATQRNADVGSAIVATQVRALGQRIPALLAKRASVALAASGRAQQGLDLLALLPTLQLDSATTSAMLYALTSAQPGLSIKLLHLAAKAGTHALPECQAVVRQLRRWSSAQLGQVIQSATPPVQSNAVRAYQVPAKNTLSVQLQLIASLPWCAPHAALALLTHSSQVARVEQERAVRFVHACQSGKVQGLDMPQVQTRQGELEAVLPEEAELQEAELEVARPTREIRQRWCAWSTLYRVTAQWIMQAKPSSFVLGQLYPTKTYRQSQQVHQKRPRSFDLQVTLSATKLRMAASALQEQSLPNEHSCDVQLLQCWYAHVVGPKRLYAPSSRASRSVIHAAFDALSAYLEQLRSEPNTLMALGPAQHLQVLELAIRLSEAKLAFGLWRTLHERPRASTDPAPMAQLKDELFEHLLLMACDNKSTTIASREPNPKLAFTLYLARVAEKPSWKLSPTGAITFIETLLGSSQHGLEASRVVQQLAESGICFAPSHCVALVGTFARAGELWADHTLGLAENLAVAWKTSNAASPVSPVGAGIRVASAETRASGAGIREQVLPPLEMYAYALDAASRAFIAWSPKRRERILQLFASFRQTLQAYLTRSATEFARAKLYPAVPHHPPTNDDTSAHAPAQAQAQTRHEELKRSYQAWYADKLGIRAARKAALGHVQRQTLLMAYNAAMRALLAEPALEQGLSVIQLARVPQWEPLLEGTGLAPASWKKLEPEKQHDAFEVLRHELEVQLGVMGNAQTWGLRIVRPLLPFQVREQSGAALLKGSVSEFSSAAHVEASPEPTNDKLVVTGASPPVSSESPAGARREATLSWKELGFTREEIFTKPPSTSALDAALELFTLASQATYLRGGDVTLPLSGAATRQSELLQPVRLKSADVGKFIVALARGGRFERAAEVNDKWDTRHRPSAGPLHGRRARIAGVEGKVMPGGWEHAVVGARLVVLALLGHREALVTEMQRLDAHAREQDTNKVLRRAYTQPYRINYYFRQKLLHWTDQAEAAILVHEGKAKEERLEEQSLEELRRSLAWNALAAGMLPPRKDKVRDQYEKRR